MLKARALIRAWLLIDFFGDARRAGRGHASSLTTTIFAQSFFALVFAALLYPETAPVPFAAANLCLSSLLVAIGALGDEARPERRVADDHLLGTAPLSSLLVTLARGGHAAFPVVLVSIGMALAPAILLAQLRGDVAAAPAYVVGACACSGLAAGALGVLARAASRCLGPARAALLTGSSKALLLGGALILFAISLPHLRGTAADLPIGATATALLPPYQIARWLASPADEAWRLVPLALGGLLLLAAATLLAGNAAPTRARVARRSLLRRLLAVFAGDGPRRGVAEFVAIAMWRSPGFRARVLPLLGVPAAMAVLTLRGSEPARALLLLCVLLQLPAIYLPFLIAFLPRADQPGSGWVFAQAPGLPLALVQDATWRALVSHVLLPVHALALALLLLTPARGDAVAASLFAAGLAIVTARLAVRQLGDVPFTRALASDDGLDLGSLFAGALVLGALAAAYALVLPEAGRWLAALAAAGAAGALLGRRPGLAEDGPSPRSPLDAGGVEAGEAPEPAADTADLPPGLHAPQDDLRRELRSIAVLYAVQCVLPLVVGTIFAA